MKLISTRTYLGYDKFQIFVELIMRVSALLFAVPRKTKKTHHSLPDGAFFACEVDNDEKYDYIDKILNTPKTLQYSNRKSKLHTALAAK